MHRVFVRLASWRRLSNQPIVLRWCSPLSVARHCSTTPVLEDAPPPKTLDELLSKVPSDEGIDRDLVCKVVTALATTVPKNEARAMVSRASTAELAPNEEYNCQKLRLVFSFLTSSNLAEMEPKGLVACLKAMSALGLDSANSQAVSNMENALIWKARTCAMRDLAFLVSFAWKRRNEGENGTKRSRGGKGTTVLLLEEAVKAAERRWVEVDDGKTLVGLFHYFPEVFGEQFARRLEDRAMDLAEGMAVEELAVVVKVLAAKKRRSVPLLRALTYHLAKKNDALDVEGVADVLFAMRRLEYRNLDAWETMCEVAERRLRAVGEAIPDTAVRSILASIGQVKFRHEGMMDRIAELMGQRLVDDEEAEAPDNRSLMTFLLTTAAIDYEPKNSKPIYDAIVRRLTRASLEGDESKTDLVWLDVVWSLTVLQRALPSHFESVLSTEFCNRILYSQHERSNVGAILKVLNVNAAATWCHPEYVGPKISVQDDPLLRDVHRGYRSEKAQLVKSVMDAVNVLAAAPNYLSVDANTNMGFVVEGEAVFDQNAKPLLVDGLRIFIDDEATATSSKKTLPSGATRVAVMVVGYHDCLMDGVKLSGLMRLCARLLEARGFRVLLIKHSEVTPITKSLDKIKYFEMKLKALLGHCPAS